MKAFIIHRDRPTYGAQCLQALIDAGVEDIYIVDHDSTYPGAQSWLTSIDTHNLATIWRLDNDHPRRLWQLPEFRMLVADEPYIVTDCDVVPDSFCPENWVEWMLEALDENPRFCKVGMSLRLTDIPARYPHYASVQTWERRFWEVINDNRTFIAAVDTTLAVYQPLSKWPRFQLAPALRTRPPFVARHLAWYERPDRLTEEQAYYRQHAKAGVSNWLDPTQYVGTEYL